VRYKSASASQSWQRKSGAAAAPAAPPARVALRCGLMLEPQPGTVALGASTTRSVRTARHSCAATTWRPFRSTCADAASRDQARALNGCVQSTDIGIVAKLEPPGSLHRAGTTFVAVGIDARSRTGAGFHKLCEWLAEHAVAHTKAPVTYWAQTADGRRRPHTAPQTPGADADGRKRQRREPGAHASANANASAATLRRPQPLPQIATGGRGHQRRRRRRYRPQTQTAADSARRRRQRGQYVTGAFTPTCRSRA
jgi:hypothetical protein